jgi:hypothetical protein
VEDVSEEVSEQITVRLDWSEAATAPAQHVNQLLGQIGPPMANGIPDGVYLTFGSVAPPVIPPPDDEAGRRAAIEALRTGLSKVSVHGRLHMSRDLLDDLIRVLQVTASQYDTAVKMASEHGPGKE